MKNPTVNQPSDPAVPPALRTHFEAYPEHERKAFEKTWSLAGLAQLAEEEPPLPDLHALWQRVSQSTGIPVPKHTHPDRPTRHQHIRHTRLRTRGFWAATFVIVLGVIGWSWWIQPITTTALPGEYVTVSLPDGSLVELNSGASLMYRRALWGWNRHVQLRGEAFFDVVPTEHAFVVETFNAEVTVLGTSFNVRAWPNTHTPETRVALATGIVQLSPLGTPDQSVQLAPNEISWVVGTASPPHPPEAVSVTSLLAWRTGGFAFHDQPLGDILQDLSRRYNLQITASPILLDAPLILYLDPQPDVIAVLDVICTFLGCQYEATETGYRMF